MMRLATVLVGSFLLSAADPIGFKIAEPTSFKLMQQGKYNGSLYHIIISDEDQYSSGPVQLGTWILTI